MITGLLGLAFVLGATVVAAFYTERARWERRYQGRHRAERLAVLDAVDLAELVAKCRTRVAGFIARSDR